MTFRVTTTILILLTCLSVTMLSRTAAAEPVIVSSRNGRINEAFSYESLEVKRGSYDSPEHGRVYSCIFTGAIVSTTHDEAPNLTVRFTAFNNFMEQLWETSVTIQSLPPFGTHEFSQKITCRERDPFYWKIEVFEGHPLPQ